MFRPSKPPINTQSLRHQDFPYPNTHQSKYYSGSEDRIVKRRQNLIAIRAGPEARVEYRLLRVKTSLDGRVVCAADVDELVTDPVCDDVPGMCQ